MADEGRVEILLEGIQDGIKLLAEGHGVVVEKIDDVAADIAVLKVDMQRVKDHLGLNGAPRGAKARKPRTRS